MFVCGGGGAGLFHFDKYIFMVSLQPGHQYDVVLNVVAVLVVVAAAAAAVVVPAQLAPAWRRLVFRHQSSVALARP